MERTIKDFVKDRTDLEFEICSKLNGFARRYGVAVDSIQVHNVMFMNGKRFPSAVELRIDVSTMRINDDAEEA
jgi:hypothetical protein